MSRYRYVLLLGVGIALVAGAVVSERSRRAALEGDAQTVRVRGKLGPTPGPDAEGYITEKRELLARLAADRPSQRAAALVSLSRLLRPAEAASMAPDASIDVVFLRAPAGKPDAVTVEGTLDASLAGWAQRASAALEAEAGQLEGLAATAPAADRQRYLSDASAKRVGAGEVLRGCACIYATALSGTTLRGLARLQESEAVRLVDVPDPPVDDLRGWELTPIFPRGA